MQGTFTVELGGDPVTVNWDSSEEEMALALKVGGSPWSLHATDPRLMAFVLLQEADTTLGGVRVTRTRNPDTDEWTGGYIWDVTFVGTLETVSAIVPDDTLLTGGDGTEDVSASVVVGTPVDVSSCSLTIGEETTHSGRSQPQVSERKVLNCKCEDTCSGSFRLGYRNGRSPLIYPDDTPATLKAKIEVSHGVDAQASFH